MVIISKWLKDMRKREMENAKSKRKKRIKKTQRLSMSCIFSLATGKRLFLEISYFSRQNDKKKLQLHRRALENATARGTENKDNKKIFNCN